jgi:mercuric ion binding protein
MKNKIKFIFCLLFFFIATAKAQEQTIVIKTSAVCGECKKHIETALNYTKGVKSANLDVESKEVTVVYKSEKTTPDKIREAISKAGYDADSIPANPKSYERLEPCCKKDGHKE